MLRKQPSRGKTQRGTKANFFVVTQYFAGKPHEFTGLNIRMLAKPSVRPVCITNGVEMICEMLHGEESTLDYFMASWNKMKLFSFSCNIF